MNIDVHVSLLAVGVIVLLEVCGLAAVLWWLERQR